MPFITIVRTITGFGGRVRTGYYGQGNQVSAVRVAVALRAIGQTCKLVYERNPLYRAPKQHLLEIELMMVGFRNDDPIPVPEIVVPVVVL